MNNSNNDNDNNHAVEQRSPRNKVLPPIVPNQTKSHVNHKKNNGLKG